MTRLASAALLALTLAGCGASPVAHAVPKAAAAVAARAMTPASFFANAALQAQAPGAFATQEATLPAQRELAASAPAERDALVAAIRADKALSKAVAGFATLTWEQRLPALQKIQALEAQVMGMAQPPLVIDTTTDRREAFFDFDPTKPGTGTVKLYPKGLAKDPNPYAALLLLVHETRHSFQFQRAFSRTPGEAGRAFQAAFIAQHALTGFSFCDFCTMLHEHEAFQTGNYVVGALTDWKVDTSDMGCYTSQFDDHGHPKLDMLAIAGQAGPGGLLKAFNQAEQRQFTDLGGTSGLRHRD